MRDILPTQARRWRRIEDVLREVLAAFAYEEIQLPLLEFTELFARGVGEATDIVEKEMYSLADRDGDSLSLRPEGTASCVRALQEHGLLYNQTQKVFYAGPMFRYEKPQKGRYRQFYQVGAEAFGFAGPDLDAELLQLAANAWRSLGVDQHVRLEINTLGASGARQAYRDALVAYLTPHRGALDADSQRRLDTNPMRILDSKVEQTQQLLVDAPALVDFVDQASLEHFEQLQRLLEGLSIDFQVNHKLVRGLDYYTHTVFEWITEDLGSQGTVCGGGRYDGLVERLGGRATPAAGFSIGLDRLVLLHEWVDQQPDPSAVAIYVCVLDATLTAAAMQVAQQLRETLDLGVRVHLGGGNLKKQLKRADACGANFAVLYGADEHAQQHLTVKHLLRGDQFTADTAAAIEQIRSLAST